MTREQQEALWEQIRTLGIGDFLAGVATTLEGFESRASEIDPKLQRRIRSVRNIVWDASMEADRQDLRRPIVDPRLARRGPLT